MENNSNTSDVQNETFELEKTIEIANKGLESTSRALREGLEYLDRSSRYFSEKEPGQRMSYLGFILVVVSQVLEILNAAPLKFEFSEKNNAILLIMGGILVVLGVSFDTYFTIKIANSHESRAQALETAAKTAIEEAQKNRDAGSKILSKLIGKSK